MIENTLILTGSNMAGKSTLLRTIGLNCILSQCIGFSYSSFCEMPITKIISIINKHDDLQYGESFYYYEAKRISSMINKKEEGYYLFLIDELLSGTNSLERVSASIAIIEYLLKKEYIISIIATHDIAIADRFSEKCTCCYLSDKIEGRRMTFDYKLKPGIIRTTNAIKMLELLGLPAEIIQNSKSNQKSLLDLVKKYDILSVWQSRKKQKQICRKPGSKKNF